MNFYQINDTDSVDLFKIEAIRMYPGKIFVFVSGREYNVDPGKSQDFLDKMASVERGIGLTQQFYSG